MNRIVRRTVCAAVLLLGATASAGAQYDFAAARDTIKQLLESQRIPAIAVAVAKGNRILWEEAFGYADVERKRPATTETMFSLASISKPFTATAMMTLVDRKVIDLDHPANDYLGAAKLRAYEGSAADMTVRRIMSHSAGLPLHYQFFYDGGPRLHSDDDAIAHYGFAGVAPGSAYFYSNLGYGIIGHIVGRASKSSYEEYLRKQVLEPLDLRHTTVSTGKELGDRAAVRYSPDFKPLLPYAFDHTGASGVWSSAHDLVRFGMYHVGAKLPEQKAILSDASRLAMQHPESPATGPGAAYGLGWATLEDDNGFRRLQHTGGMPGVSTMLNLYPADSVVVVVLTNRDGATAMGRIATMLAGVVLPRYNATREERRAAGAARGQGSSSAPPASLAGSWKGFVIVEGDSLPVSLEIGAGGPSRIKIGNDTAKVLNNAALQANGWFSGGVRSPLRPPEAAPASERDRNAVQISLRKSGERLTGWASSIAQGPPAYGAVSYRLELQRD